LSERCQVIDKPMIAHVPEVELDSYMKVWQAIVEDGDWVRAILSSSSSSFFFPSNFSYFSLVLNS